MSVWLAIDGGSQSFVCPRPSGTDLRSPCRKKWLETRVEIVCRLEEIMKMKARSVQQIVQDQVHLWQIAHTEAPKIPGLISVITISREPGSGGNILAERLGDELGYDVYHQKILHQMAESTHISTSFLEHLDEKGLNPIQNCIFSLVDHRHLWPDQYLRHLLKIIGSIGKHGHAVVVGRGANFILPPAQRLSVRVVAPQQLRIERVSRDFGISMQEAKQRVQSNRVGSQGL